MTVKALPVGKRSLRSVLVIPFLLQIFAAVGLTGYISWRNGQRAVNAVAFQLRQEISARIHDKLADYAECPHLINQINADAVRRGTLSTQSQSSEQYLWRQIQLLEHTTWLYYGSQGEGSFVGVNRTSSDTFVAVVNEPATQFQGQFYSLDEQGNRIERIETNPERYDARPVLGSRAL